MGYGRDRGLVHGHIADRVGGGADGSCNRSLSRTVTLAGCWWLPQGVFDLLGDQVIVAVDAVQVDLVQDPGAGPGSRGDLGRRAAGVQPQRQGGVAGLTATAALGARQRIRLMGLAGGISRRSAFL